MIDNQSLVDLWCGVWFVQDSDRHFMGLDFFLTYIGTGLATPTANQVRLILILV